MNSQILPSKRDATAPKTAVKFGTDGWRGIIARDFTFENVRLAAHAVAQTYEPELSSRAKVLVGYDHRFLAENFADEAAKVLASYRFDPHPLSGAVTSPLLSFITWKEKAPFGVMLTASHNPAEYCGFKLKGTFGGSISQSTVGRIEKTLSEILASGRALPAPADSVEPAKLEPYIAAYIQYLISHIDIAVLKKSKARLTYDVLYGPGGKTTQAFYQSIKSSLDLNIIHNRRDPLFGGLHPEPIEDYLGELKKSVVETKSAAGFALDGDADRLGMTDEKGQYMTPQQIFALLLFYLASEKKLKGRVVQAVSLGYLSERIAQDFELPFKEVPVGFKYVAEEILKGDVLLGGEESGGFAFSKTSAKTKPGTILPERDGLFCSLLFSEMLLKSGKKTSQLLAELQKRYGVSGYLRKDIHLDRPIEDKSEFIRQVQSRFPSEWLGIKIKEMRTLDGLKIVLEDGSWILIRPSGTEPLLRTYAEFPKKELSKKSLENLSKVIRG